jgi:plasmid replication initiation protein
MSNKNDMETINALQNDSDYVVLSNPLASPKFVRMIGKDKEMTISDTYTPKIFYEIVSRLTPENLEGIKENQSIKLDININQFLKDIGANSKNYKHLITSIEALQTILFKWKENGLEHRSTIINYSIHDPKSGKVQIQIHEKMVKHILEVKQKDNFSFLKSNIFRLQNAQSIRLYPFFKSWLNHGRYVTDLERFKNDFGYNTSGYAKYSNFEVKVLNPAIEEINEKTDLLVNYVATGDNLDGKRPRIKGLIFVIKSKNKQLKTVEQNEKQPQEQKPQREKTQQNELSTLYTIFTSLKFEATARLPRETAEATIMQWIDKNGYDAVYNGLMRAKDTYKGEIKNPIGFFSGNYFKEYKDYIKQKEQAKEEQKRTKEEQAQKEHQARKLKIILDDFKKRESEYYVKLYNDQAEDVKAYYIEEIKNNPMYYKHGEITKVGIYFLGKTIAETATEYNPRKTLQNLAQRDYNTNVMFDKEGKPFIQEGLFEEQPQEQTEPPQNIEAVAPPTMPQPTTPLPHSQEQTEPTPSDFFNQNQKSNQDFEKTVEEVETPKSIKSLLGKWFK